MPEPHIPELLDAVVQAMGGAKREGQVKMAEAVWEAFASGRHRLVQAGTGTGKSLAYLVPAAAWSVEKDERVVVATATLALQRQIMEHDFPLVREALEGKLGRQPVGALLKGRNNYVCQHRLNGGYESEQGELTDGIDLKEGVSLTGSSLADELRRLTAWANRTKTGDRDDFPGGVSNRAWQQVSVNSAQCLGQDCPLAEACFTERARQRAAKADLVVINHAILAIEALGTGILPEFSALIIDEAHNLTSSLTRARTVSLVAKGVTAAASRLKKLGSDEAAKALVTAATALADAVATCPAARLRPPLPEPLMAALGQVRAAARPALSEVMGLPDAPAAAKQMAGAALDELCQICDRLTAATGDVVWISRPNDRGAQSEQPEEKAGVNAAPLDVAADLREHVLGEVTAVMTSATLALGGSLEPAARAAGLSTGEWEGLDVGSPFDYGRQGILYVASDLPEPSRDSALQDAHQEAQHERIEKLIRAAGGGALGLFTSQRAAEAAAEALVDKLDFPIGLQGEKSLPALIEDFLADPRACLFGTVSLWQGIDAPGATCRLVLIDRLPFPRPDDPVMSARAEAADKAGASGFMSGSAAQAALMLAQGAG
ncbi:MAG: ATP-dependent DNA helicase, partial [Bifidobacteriaceae bacterium]|nr:ATP-dependent DNA helicase [Bifidobacteriaceae bacterium]